MKYVLLNTPKTVAVGRRTETLTAVIARQTEKAVLIEVTYSRFPGEPDAYWFPKASVAVGDAGLVIHEPWIIEKKGFPKALVSEFGFVYPDRDQSSVRIFVVQCLCDGHIPSQDEIDAGIRGQETPVQQQQAQSMIVAHLGDLSSILRRAWQIARAAAARFGGASREFIASAMKMAWAEARV